MAVVGVATKAGLFTLGDAHGVDLEGRDVVDISGGPDASWALAGSSLLQRRSPQGSWAEVASVPGRTPRCVLETPFGMLVGTDRAHLLRVEGARVERLQGFEDAPGRDEWFTPWGGPPDVRSMTQSADTVYVNVHVGGILRSGDGASWTPTIDIRTDVHEVIAHDGMLFAATALGLAASRDEGTSWDFDDGGLHGSYARAVAVARDDVLLTASLGPRGGRAAVYRRSIAGSGFKKSHEGLPEWFPHNIDSGCLAADGDVAAFGTVDGSVYVSHDGGTSWEVLASGLPEVRAVALGPL